MRRKNLLCIILFSLLFTKSSSQIRILFSAALSDYFYEFRKQQYIESLKILKNMGYRDVYIVEALRAPGPTFLNTYSKNVFYSTANNPKLRNNGINEARTTLQGTYYFKFDPDDMIIKFTGRYQLLSDSFIKLVQNNPDVDAFVHFHPNGNVYTFAFAIRCKYFQEMFEQVDYEKTERNMICIETEVANYIRKKMNEGNFKVMHVEKFDIKADVQGSTNSDVGSPTILYF
jgi:hypothetical protein